MNPDLDALATRLYVTVDDLLIDHPEWAPERPAIGIAPQLSDAELITLAVIQALLGFTSEARFIRHARTHLRSLFPYVPQRPAYNKRLRHAAATMQHLIEVIARDCPVLARRSLVGRLHTRRVRPLTRNGEAFRHGRLRQLRLLRVAFPVLLGGCASI